MAVALCLAAMPLCLCQAQAKATMHEVFRAMPDSLVGTLTTNNRLDLIDFFDSKMRAAVTDRLDGEATLDTLAADYLRLTLDGGVGVEMKLLPVDARTDSAGYRVCLVRSYGQPVAESAIEMYSSAWQPLGQPGFVQSEGFPATLLQRTDTATEADHGELQARHPLLTVSFALSPDNTDIVASGVFPLLTGDEKERMPALLSQKTYHWDGETFK